MATRRPASRHSFVKLNQPRSWYKGPDLRRNYLSLFLVELTISLVGVVVTLASAMAFGTRLQRRRTYEIKGGNDWSNGDEDVFSKMVQIAPAFCSGSVFAVFFLLAYKMMMPKYKRQIFLSSHLFCVVSMLCLSVYAVIILVDVLKFPHGSVGFLDTMLDKEIGVLNKRQGNFHQLVPFRQWDKLEKKKTNKSYSCCGAYSELITTIMHREEPSFLRYYHNDSSCDNDKPKLKFEDDDCIHSESCFYKDAAVYGNRVVLFLIFSIASAISAAVTVGIVIKQDKQEAETDPPREESVRRTEIPSPAIPVELSKPNTPTESPSPINIPQLQ